jgi:hypothetical protein
MPCLFRRHAEHRSGPPTQVSDQDLVATVARLVTCESSATASLIAILAPFDSAQGVMSVSNHEARRPTFGPRRVASAWCQKQAADCDCE